MTLAPSIRPRAPLLLCIKHKTEDVETKLRELETHAPELLFGLVSEDVRPRGPEGRDGFPDALVSGLCVCVDVPGVGDFAVRRRRREVDLFVGEGGERGHAEALREGVDAGVSQEADA